MESTKRRVLLLTAIGSMVVAMAWWSMPEGESVDLATKELRSTTLDSSSDQDSGLEGAPDEAAPEGFDIDRVVRPFREAKFDLDQLESDLAELDQITKQLVAFAEQIEELDQDFKNQKLSTEEFLARRKDLMTRANSLLSFDNLVKDL